MISKRRVIFGNPSLGTYEYGYVVYTNSDNTNDKTTTMVAITNVPPDQIPEGLLNLARGYRSSIEHIRVVISDNDYDEHEHENESDSQQQHQHQNNQRKEPKKKKYLVLITFSSFNDANLFVQNIHGKPYNSFERDVIASVYHVVTLKNDCDDNDDVENDNDEKKKSFMNPFLSSKIQSNQEGKEQNSGCKRRTLSSSSSQIILMEKQNCAVCLEPMEFISPSTSIFTTVCNHSFHTECILKCQDSPCPVCRYDHSGLNETLSTCHVCGTTERIYVCLICGVASCWNKPVATRNSGSSAAAGSRSGQSNQIYTSTSLLSSTSSSCCDNHAVHYNNSLDSNTNGMTMTDDCTMVIPTPECNVIRGHAQNHYNETLHAYALDTETQHVWDFAGQGYVHRLIENDNDGKIVEVSNPRQSSAMERSLIPELSDTQEGEVVHRKLEGYANEYYKLLKSQLEQQRIYYEGVMEDIRLEHKTKSSGNSTAELIAALKQDRHQLQQRCMVLQKKRDKVLDDVVFLKNMNESLEANKEPMKRQIMLLQNQRNETTEMLRRRLPELEDKVKALMLELEADE